MRRRDIALLGAAGLIPATSARAQGSWPDRPVMVISPYPPGGGSDIVARAVAKALGDATGQPFVVENRSGAAGSLGAAQVARARPDGYTILIGGSSPIAANKLLYRNLPYDPEKDFTPLSLVAEAPLMLMANPSTPVRSVPELVAYAKARPGEVTCANAGSGSKGHLAVLALCHRAGIELNHIPYRGTGPAQTDILAGTVMVGIDTASVYVPHVRSGAVRALGGEMLTVCGDPARSRSLYARLRAVGVESEVLHVPMVDVGFGAFEGRFPDLGLLPEDAAGFDVLLVSAAQAGATPGDALFALPTAAPRLKGDDFRVCCWAPEDPALRQRAAAFWGGLVPELACVDHAFDGRALCLHRG